MMAKNTPPSLVILMAEAMCWCKMVCISQHGRYRATIDATGSRQRLVFALHCPGGCHGHQFWRRKSSFCVVRRSFRS